MKSFSNALLAVAMAWSLGAVPARADKILDLVPADAPGMYVAITGSGSALPDPQRGGASVAVVIDGEVLQFDFGRQVMENQLQVGINPADVDYVFLTHHHFDHIAQLGYYAMSA